MFKTSFISCGLIMLVIAVISIAHIAEAQRTCPENEFYTKCGDNCQTECSTLNQPCYVNYVMCPSGCYCNKGYARDDNGKCIPISQCSK